MPRLLLPLLCAVGLCLPCATSAADPAPKQFEGVRETKPSEDAKKQPLKVKATNAGGAAGVVIRQSSGASSSQTVRDEVDAKDAKERVLLLAPGGPIVVESSITLDGEPFRMARERLVEELLKQADSHGDGKPTWSEAVANPRFGFGRFAYYTRTDAQRDSTIKRYDTNGDGAISPAEARSLIANIGYGPVFRVLPVSSGYSQPDVKTILDEDGDGDISQQELAAAAEKLKSRDANDNDLLESSEAGGGVRRNYNFVQSRTQGRTARPALSAYLLGPTADLVAIYSAMKEKYAGADEKIQAEDFIRFRKLVQQLDLDDNGVLDSGEAIGLHLLKPHVTLEVNLGESDKLKPGVRLVSVAPELGKPNRQSKEFAGQVDLEVPGLKLSFAARPSTRTYANYARSAQSLLTRYDTDKNGYVEQDEFKKAAGQQNTFAERQFAVWDANGDGKVFAKEIEQAYQQQLAPQLSAVSASSATQGPSFFAALDETGDNRLSLREMKNAAGRLAEFDKDKDGKLGIEEMPVEMTLAFGRGYYNYYNTASGRVVFGGNVRPGTSGAGNPNSRGPEWFVRMDKNGDGDLTPREFLGGAETFKQIDTNGDGFIERKEAEAVEAKDK